MLFYTNIKEQKPKVVIFTESQLVEALTDIVYHTTSLKACYNILRENTIYLQSALGGVSDNLGGGKKFYLSTSRQRSNVSGYLRNQTYVARIELDGTKLNQRYGGKPVDYWGREYHNIQSGQTSEMEDRLITNESEIHPASKYIRRIDILLGSSDDEYADTGWKYATHIYYAASRIHVPLYVYTDQNEFNKQSNKTVNEKLRDTDNFNQMDTLPYDQYGNSEYDLIEAIGLFGYLFSLQYDWKTEKKQAIEYYSKLLRKYDLGRFLSRSDDIFRKMRYGMMGGIYDACSQLSNRVGQLSRRPNKERQNFVRLLSDFFNEHGLNTYRDLQRYLVTNFNVGTEAEKRQYYDFNNAKEFLTFEGLNGYPAYLIEDPYKESFWSLFKDRDDFVEYLFDTLDRYHYREGEGEMDKLYKYLQHIAKSNISIDSMIEMLDKLGLSDEEKWDLLGGKFEKKPIGFYDIWRYDILKKFKSDDEKDLYLRNLFLKKQDRQ